MTDNFDAWNEQFNTTDLEIYYDPDRTNYLELQVYRPERDTADADGCKSAGPIAAK